MMVGGKLRERKIGPDKAAISSYGERILEGSSIMKNFLTYYPETPSTKTRELHQAKRDSSQYNQSRKQAESEITEAKSELSAAKKTVKDLSLRIEESNSRAKTQIQEIENAKELENKLAITISDISVLESELKQVKEMEKRKESLRYNASNVPEVGEKMGDVSLLDSVTKELEAAKKELASIKEDSFQFLASMDIVRNELKHVAEETSRLKKKEEKSEIIIQNLNLKLLIAKAKLEVTSAAEDKAKSIVSNLSLTLEQLNSKAETSKKERSLISEDTAIIKAEVHKTETEIDLAEERLQAAVQDLKAVKSSEAMALENLKAQIEITMRNRASASQRSSTITISKFEYEYLIGHAAGAKEMADKKVAAAHAWIEALKASEKEIMIKSELLRRESRELEVEEEREVHKTERSLSAKKVVEKELEKRRQKREQKTEPKNLQPEIALPSKAMNRSFKMTPARKAKSRRASSPVDHNISRSTSFTIRRRKKIMPNIAKFFSGRRSTERNR